MAMRPKWKRWGLVALSMLAIGCGTGPSGSPSKTPGERAAAPAAGGRYTVQQNLAPGEKGTPERRRYCAEWQCASVGTGLESWCMQSCTYDWDL